MTDHSSRLSRITFWIVFVQAVLVIVLLGVTLLSFSQQADNAALRAEENQAILENNQLLIEALQIQQRVGGENTIHAVEAVFCLLLIVPEERDQTDVDQCLTLFNPLGQNNP